MGYGITIRVRGPYALFTRPEMKVERVSYDVITPSAARGIIEAIYWKPAIRWVIDKIHVLREIQFTNIRRNEVSEKVSVDNAMQVMKGAHKALYISAVDNRQQRASMVLKDVDYVIEAHFVMTDKAGAEDSEEKHFNIVLRRLRQGQCFHALFGNARIWCDGGTHRRQTHDSPKSVDGRARSRLDALRLGFLQPARHLSQVFQGQNGGRRA